MYSKEVLHICGSCRETFNKKNMLESSEGVGYCTECFKKLYYNPSGDQKDTRDARDKLVPYPELFCTRKKHAYKANSRSPSVVSLSKRPLQCPKADCNKFVSIFTLESHFKYEHKEVPIIVTQLDSRSALEFYPRDVRYGITQCIVLLNVVNYDFSGVMPQTSNYCSRTNLQTTKSQPVMILLATRLPCHQVAQTSSCANNAANSDDEDGQSTRTYVENVHDIMLPDDHMIIWLASNIVTNLSYTVAASTLNNKIRQKFFGPMILLGDDLMELYTEGNCLTLTHFHVNGMSENGVKPLALDIVIHTPD